MILRLHCFLAILAIMASSAVSDVLESRVKRDYIDPIPHLDQLINHLIHQVSQSIDESVLVSESKLRGTVAKRVTQGWSIVAASWFDVISDYILEERTLGNLKGDMTVIYKYMFLLNYGVGFGFPLLLGLPDDTKDCGSDDFFNSLRRYQLDQGLAPLLQRGAEVDDLRSVISEFQTVIGTQLYCLDSSENIESQKAVNSISNLIAAMATRLDAEERLQSESNRRAFVTKMEVNSTAIANF